MHLLRATSSAVASFSLSSSPFPSPSPSLPSSSNITYVFNKSVTTVTSVLTNLRASHNATSKQLTLFIGNQNLKPFVTTNNPTNNLTIVSIISVIVAIGLIGFILFTITEKMDLKFKKEKIDIHSPINWIMNMYKRYTKKEIIPITSPKKAKESPFIGPIPTPSVLPNCDKLDEVEKGQNIMFRFRGPISARFESTNTLYEDDKTQFTIITIV
jgi:hypothetical protein